MINDNTILSSFNDRPTLLEWLKKVEEALKSDTATGVSVENPSVNSYIFKITFADGKTIASDTIRFPDSVKGVSILNNHLVLTMQSGLTDDLGVINPYADTIVLNSETNTTEIGNNAVVDGNLQVNSNVLFGNSVISIRGTTKQNGILGTNADGKIAFKEISGGGGTRNLEVNPTYVRTEGEYAITNFTITDEERNKILNGEIDIISGRVNWPSENNPYFFVVRTAFERFGESNGAKFMGNLYDNATGPFSMRYFECAITNKNSINLFIYKINLAKA